MGLAFGRSRGSRRGSQTAVARLGHGTSSMYSPRACRFQQQVGKKNPQVLLQFLVPGTEALETKVLGAVSKGKSQGTGREAQGTQQLAARSSSLHREHTTKPRNIRLSVWFGAQHLRDVLGGWSSLPGGWGAPSGNSEGAEHLGHRCQPLFPSTPSGSWFQKPV